MSNPRYPHKCRIYRIEDDSFSDGAEIELYNGICRKQSSTNLRAFKTGSTSYGQVTYGSYRVSIPTVLKNLKNGDLMDIEDYHITEKGVEISDIVISAMFDGVTKVIYTNPNI